MPRYAELLYNGFWFSPEREALQAAIDSTQKFVTGTVRLKLYKVRPPAPPCVASLVFVSCSAVSSALLMVTARKLLPASCPS